MTITTQPRLRSGLLAAAVASVLQSVPVHAATSFPDYPLQSGAGTVPPNILFMLDNSGSMAWDYMAQPGAADPTGVNLTYALTRNSLAYNPGVTYTAWDAVDAAGAATRVSGGTTYSAAYRDDTQAPSATAVAVCSTSSETPARPRLRRVTTATASMAAAS